MVGSPNSRVRGMASRDKGRSTFAERRPPGNDSIPRPDRTPHLTCLSRSGTCDGAKFWELGNWGKTKGLRGRYAHLARTTSQCVACVSVCYGNTYDRQAYLDCSSISKGGWTAPKGPHRYIPSAVRFAEAEKPSSHCGGAVTVVEGAYLRKRVRTWMGQFVLVGHAHNAPHTEDDANVAVYLVRCVETDVGAVHAAGVMQWRAALSRLQRHCAVGEHVDEKDDEPSFLPLARRRMMLECTTVRYVKRGGTFKVLFSGGAHLTWGCHNSNDGEMGWKEAADIQEISLLRPAW